MTSWYEPLIERDLEAIPGAARAFLETHTAEELWTSVARFAVLAYAPSQHGKRAVMAVRAAHDVREAMGERWVDLLIECARYAAEGRQPWSEPPILDPPPVDPTQPNDRDALRTAIEAKDRPRAEQWLAARSADADDDLRVVAEGDALLVTDAVFALAPHLGDKGRYALLRIAIWEMLAGNDPEPIPESIDDLIADVIAQKGSIESVRRVLLWSAGRQPAVGQAAGAPTFTPYHLSRDYAQTLLAHATPLPPGANLSRFLAAVHENLAQGESYENWS
jgi:hypothetical protein